MADIIQLLPDSVANQIAAGEVIQRPASAVKELLENAVDSGATEIKLIVKDAGKTLIQVIDNGCGMSETDARMSFERHATSKIKKADDLFNIRTKGFRGEALASIAAIAHVELKTKLHDSQIGTQIIIEGSELKNQSACSCTSGTSFSVKNLFFNVPARRNFLKSDNVEFRHIIDEFQRVALPHSEISFSLHHNNSEVFHLECGSMKQRIIGIFGANYNERLVPVKEETEIVKVAGYIGKPEFAKRTRGEQFFFVNNRFIKNAYLNHAVQAAYAQLLPNDSFPSYFLFLEINPQAIDINIHPTKTEIKFEDEKSIYAILRASIKQSLGKYNIAPTLDFEQETSFNIPLKSKNEVVELPQIKINPGYNPFSTDKKTENYIPDFQEISNKKNWEKLYSKHADNQIEIPVQKDEVQKIIDPKWGNETETLKQHLQLHGKYILAHIKSGFMIIDQQTAHERILYEKFSESLEKNKGTSQQMLFPQHIEFSASDFDLIKELHDEIHALGFDIQEFGKNTFIVHGVPPETSDTNPKKILEQVIEHYKMNLAELKSDKRENIARSMAKSSSIKEGKNLSQQEMTQLVDELFTCKMPFSSPSGKPTLTTFSLEDLDRRFKK